MSDKQQAPTQEYQQPQFEAAFQLITAISNQLIRVDYQEMKRWINNLMTPKTLPASPGYNENARPNLDNLIAVMDALQTMKDTLLERGIPVRDIQKYREHHPAGQMLDDRHNPNVIRGNTTE
jgi:hypothetical protein